MDAPRRCLDCYYILDGLSDSRCPECGRAFDLDLPQTFTTKPPFIWWKFWLPGFVIATVGGAVIYALLITQFGYGVSVAIVTPFALGIIIGYACTVRASGVFFLVIMAIVAVGFTLYSANLVGIFCGLILGLVAILPAAAGSVVGLILRQRLKKSRFSQRQWLPVILLWLAPALAGFLEGRQHYKVETIRTTALVPASLADTWDGVCFYEEVKHEPPLLLRMLLPKPLYATGHQEHVGDVKYCIYSKGRLVKRITRSETRELLAFDVIEQFKIEVRSIRLTGGSFRFEPVSPQLTRVTLSTDYEPLLGPRFAWSWAERWATHALHGHVLRGMSEHATEIAWQRSRLHADAGSPH